MALDAEAVRRVRRLVVVTTILALVAAVGGPVLSAGPAVHPGWFCAVVVLVGAAHVFGWRLRIGSTVIHVAWGEAVVIIGFVLIPALWMPLAVGLGVLGAKALVALYSQNRADSEDSGPLQWLRAASALAISAAAAAFLVVLAGIPIGPTAKGETYALGPNGAVVLALAAVTYLLGTAALLGIYLSVRDAQSRWQEILRALRDTPFMVVGNLALGLLSAALWANDNPTFLWVLPPLLWLMHQLYARRLREDEERRNWREFAVASGSLHRLDEVAVAREGVWAAQTLFPVREVELAVFGSQSKYRSSDSSSSDDDEMSEEDDFVVVRSLEVAGTQVGALKLRLSRSGGLSAIDQHRLAVFGDGLAAALHDAATHNALRELRARTVYESHHDPLTKLLNRDALLAQGEAIMQVMPNRAPVALLLLDLDHFKNVNDTLGHLAGDELLQQVAARLSEDMSPDELVARLGGDEFGLLLTGLPIDSGSTETAVAATAVALRRARSLAARLTIPTKVAGVTLSTEVSVGVVVALSPVDLTELLRRADIALYEAKESGARVTAYDPGRDNTSTDQLALVAEMRSALDGDDQLMLVFQPSVDLRTGSPTGVEALARWQHPRRGPLLPKHFVRAVEGSDLLGPFTRRVVDLALAEAVKWREQGFDLPVAVNLSPRSLLDPHLPDDIAGLLKRHGMPASSLILEIIETVVMSPLKVTDQVLRELRALGVQLAVDDFGTGFSSLTFLTRIVVDELKIDRTFVAAMGESPQAAAIVRAVIELGRQIGIRVVAEGVERSDQRNALAKQGCHGAQGFFFSEPVSAERIGPVLRQLRGKERPMRAVG